jgi:hypothetical protein
MTLFNPRGTQQNRPGQKTTQKGKQAQTGQGNEQEAPKPQKDPQRGKRTREATAPGQNKQPKQNQNDNNTTEGETGHGRQQGKPRRANQNEPIPARPVNSGCSPALRAEAGK